MTWTLDDPITRSLIDDLSTYCIRDQCCDGLTHPRFGFPMKQSTRIQTNDTAFAQHFAPHCQGHEQGHIRVEGGNITYQPTFYPKRFCQRAVQLWKYDNNHTAKSFLTTYQSSQHETDNHRCADCHSINPTICCLCCSSEMSEPKGPEDNEAAMPAVHQLLREIPEDDEGDIERTTEQRLMRVHRNLGHPSNRLLVQILREAKAPPNIIENATKLQCPSCARYIRAAPARPTNPMRATELGHTVAMDFSYHTTPDNVKIMVLHFIDEASNDHTTKIVREAKVHN